jgi:hypothetical protein
VLAFATRSNLRRLRQQADQLGFFNTEKADNDPAA